MADKRQPYSGTLFCYVSNFVALGHQKYCVENITFIKPVSVGVVHFVRCTFIPAGFDKSWTRLSISRYPKGSFLESNLLCAA